ncbi:MAG TPA: flagellar hook-basal body complex protein FliE [Acidisarcina sp.]|nr:flagellar hook-basal body complex protein FliE [Acidisarcina sp.]
MQSGILQTIQSSVMQAGSSAAASTVSPLTPGASGEAPPFGKLLRDAISNVQQLESSAAQTTQALMRGDGVDIHAAMIATQKADLAFDLALAVRNKAVTAYQQVMGMQF